MSAIKLRIKIIVKAIFHALFGRTRLKAWILRVFSRDYELDSAKLAELIAKPLAKDAPKGDFIATLTSFPARIGILKYALHSIFSQDLRAKKVVLVLDKNEFLESNESAESSVDSANSQNLGKNNPRVSANLETRPLRGAKNRIQGCRSATADFLLEAEKRGSPPKSEKRSFWRVGGAGRGVQPFCEKEKGEISGRGSAESGTESRGGLPRRFCESARNDEIIRDSSVATLPQNDKVGLDSSLRLRSAQNDKNSVRVAESALDSALPTQLDNLLPAEILAFKKYGLEIFWVEQNLRQYNKIIPILCTFPNEVIITIDDDIYYPRNLFSTLYSAHLSNKRVIWAHKARIVPFSARKIADFFEWKIIRKRHKKSQNLPRFNIFLEGCGGVLYPPNCLYKDAQDCAKFMRLAPKADDIWLWAMAILKGTKIACVKPPLMGDGAAFTNSASNPALWHYNMNGGNDRQMRAVLEEYPQILRILVQEKASEKGE